MAKLTREDLIGTLKRVQIIGFNQTEKNDAEIFIFTVKDEDNKQFSFGAIGKGVEAVFDHSSKEKDGNFVEVPETKLKENETLWINAKY